MSRLGEAPILPQEPQKDGLPVQSVEGRVK